MATPTLVELIHLQNDCGHGPSKVKVSSVLNRDVKQFGKRFMFDGDEETCWNSDQGTPQYIVIEFPLPTLVNSIHIRFQGGFVGKECALMAQTDSEWTDVESFYPQDSNALQIFNISGDSIKAAKLYKLLFKESTDFFGRVTVYQLQFYGQSYSTPLPS